MTMQVTHQENVSVLLKFLYHIFHVVNRRVQLAGWIDPASVQVHASQITSGAAVDNAIDVEHRNDLEDEVVSESLCLDISRSQIVNDSLYHPRGACFTRVNPWWNDDTFSSFDHLGIRSKRGDYQHVAIVASNSLTEWFSSHSGSGSRIIFQFVQISAKISECVRIAVRQVDYVRFMLKRDRPSESIVVTVRFALRVLVVADVSAAPNPAFAWFFGLSFWVKERSHAVIVQTIGLHEVNDVEAVLFTSSYVPDSEVVPLGVAASIVIRL